MKTLKSTPIKKITNLVIILLALFTYTNLMGCVHVTINHSPDDYKLELIREKSFKTTDGKNLTVEASGGDVKINSWDKSEVTVKIYGNDRAKETMKFRLDETTDGVEVEAKRSGSAIFSFWKNIRLKFEISVPKNYNTKVNTSGGDISLMNLNGNVVFKTSGGDIKLGQVNGNVKLSTSGGDISASDINGYFKASTSGGDIKVKKFKGDTEVSTSGGDIWLQGQDGKISASTSGGDISLDYYGKNNGIKLSTSGGDINVKVDNDFNAEIDLSTLGGDVSSTLTLSKVIKKKSSVLKGTANAGGEKLECSTLGGDISVRTR